MIETNKTGYGYKVLSTAVMKHGRLIADLTWDFEIKDEDRNNGRPQVHIR